MTHLRDNDKLVNKLKTPWHLHEMINMCGSPFYQHKIRNDRKTVYEDGKLLSDYQVKLRKDELKSHHDYPKNVLISRVEEKDVDTRLDAARQSKVDDLVQLK